MATESPIDVTKPVGANNLLWSTVQAEIRVTFVDVDAKSTTATGRDLATQRLVFTATLKPTARNVLIEVLKTFNFTQDTVVVPDPGGTDKGPKMTIHLNSGTGT